MKTRKIMVTLLALALLALPVVSVGAAEDVTVSLRIEGAEETYYAGETAVEAGASVMDLLVAVAEENDLTLTGVEAGFISAVNGESAGTFGGFDGWLYRVNGVEPSVGAGDYTLAAGDKVVFYYGAYPSQLPTLTIQGTVLTFISIDNEYDENFNATQVNAPVVGATVTIGGKTYTTDENGQVDAADLPDGDYVITIEKKDESGAPAVIRLAAEDAVWYKATVTTTTETTGTTAPPVAGGETGSAAAGICLLGGAALVALVTMGRKRV